MNKKECVLREQNEFLQDMIASLEDLKAGRVKELK
jgi:hypothetical protein